MSIADAITRVHSFIHSFLLSFIHSFIHVQVFIDSVYSLFILEK